MKILIKKYLLFIIAIVLLSGCSLFRKKKRCADCPDWSKIEIPGSTKGEFGFLF